MGVFLRGIPNTTTREELKERFGTYGNVVAVTIVPSRTHETYTAYVDFDSEAPAQKVGSSCGRGVEVKVWGHDTRQ
jgi:RNA recognition motif-containing protein